MMARDKNNIIQLHVRLHELLHLMKSYMTQVLFNTKKSKQTVEPAQYGLKGSFNRAAIKSRPLSLHLLMDAYRDVFQAGNQE